LLEELAQDLRGNFTLNIHAMLDYKTLQELQILNGKMLKQRATHTSLPLSPRAPQNGRALPPLAKELAEKKCPYTKSHNTSPHRGILVNTWSSPSDGCASTGPSRPPNASTSIIPCVAHFEASRRTGIPSPPNEPSVLALWSNQGTRRFCGEPPQILADSVQPPRQDTLDLDAMSSWLGVGFVAKPTNHRARLCRAIEEPNGFVVNCRKPCMQGTTSPRQASGPPSLSSPSAPWRSTQSYPVQWLGCYLAPDPCSWLRLTFLATVRPALDIVGHQVPRTKPTSLFAPWKPHRHRPFALDLHLHHTNQAATYTCNTQPRVSLHHVANHSSHQGATIHWSSDAVVLRTSPTTKSTNVVKSWEIRSHGESNPGPEVLPGLL
jgi:hypothetical protein